MVMAARMLPRPLRCPGGTPWRAREFSQLLAHLRDNSQHLAIHATRPISGPFCSAAARAFARTRSHMQARQSSAAARRSSAHHVLRNVAGSRSHMQARQSSPRWLPSVSCTKLCAAAISCCLRVDVTHVVCQATASSRTAWYTASTSHDIAPHHVVVTIIM